MKSLRWPGGFVDRRLPEGVGLWWEGGPALARGPRGFPGASLFSGHGRARAEAGASRFPSSARASRGMSVDRSTRPGRGQLVDDAKPERRGRRQKAVTPRAAASGLSLERVFTRPGVHPFDEVEWELRSATLTNERGELIFEQRDCELPKSWSQLATNVVVS